MCEGEVAVLAWRQYTTTIQYSGVQSTLLPIMWYLLIRISTSMKAVAFKIKKCRKITCCCCSCLHYLGLIHWKAYEGQAKDVNHDIYLLNPSSGDVAPPAHCPRVRPSPLSGHCPPPDILHATCAHETRRYLPGFANFACLQCV